MTQTESSSAELPRIYYYVAVSWVVAMGLAYFFGLSTYRLYVFAPVAIFCYLAIIFRPMHEAPAALMLLATGVHEMPIYVGAPLFLFRAWLENRVLIPAKTYMFLFLAFLFFAFGSAVVSWITIEFRPLQTVFWSITFLAPLTLMFLSFDIRPAPLQMAKFGLALLALQAIPLAFQLRRFIEAGHPDAFRGSFGDADVVGFWGTALLMGSVAWILQRGITATSVKTGALGFLYTVIASAKAYSGSVLICSLLAVLLKYDGVFHRTAKGEVRGLIALFITSALLLSSLVALSLNQNAIQNWVLIQYDHSQKTVFYNRVFTKMSDYGYSELIGTGPGMLGSRAANSVSPQVLAKEKQYLPDWAMNAPKPVVKVMDGLFESRLLERISSYSATLVFPFAGYATIKGELGYVGLVLIILAVLTRFWGVSPKNVPDHLGVVHYTLAAAGLGTILLALFDNIWEMPRITLFMAGLILGTLSQVKGYEQYEKPMPTLLTSSPPSPVTT